MNASTRSRSESVTSRGRMAMRVSISRSSVSVMSPSGVVVDWLMTSIGRYGEVYVSELREGTQHPPDTGFVESKSFAIPDFPKIEKR